MTDPLRIHLSLVSHTNIGKTTLARTLLMRDVGEVADRAHVTETTDDYVLARAADGSELILWDTPGFGNSVALAKRLEGRANPIGWFLSSVWDRFANKSFWLDQRAIAHIRDASSVVLYLVNVAERPQTSSYVPAEMKILSWIGKPVLVLLNQMGPPREPSVEAAEIAAWQEALAPYPFVKAILPMDAFARCWVQESALFSAIGAALPSELRSAFGELQTVWLRSRQAIYASSIEAMAAHLRHLMTAKEIIPAVTLKDRALSVAKRFGFRTDDHNAVSDAQSALAAAAADSFCSLTTKLIGINGLKGGASKEIFRRMKTDWQLATYTIDAGSAAAIGTGLGAATGAAAAGLAVDAATGGLSLGLGTLIGGLIGAVGGIGAAAVYNLRAGNKASEVTWSDKAIEGFMLETVLLYLAVAHFGRGRGEWAQSESPAFWKEAVLNAIHSQKFPVRDWREQTPDALQCIVGQSLDNTLRRVFAELYGLRI